MDPFEKYDMTFNGAVAARLPRASAGKYAGQDNGWLLAPIVPTVMEFNKSIVDYPSIKRFPVERRTTGGVFRIQIIPYRYWT